LTAPVTDLEVDAIEVIQSMQNLDNSIELVAGKRTFVRVYVHSTTGIHPTTALLKVQSGSASITLLPIAPGGPFINVRPTYNRLLSSHAFLFELPFWYTFGDHVTLAVEVNPERRWHPHNPVESNYDNNFIAITVRFDFVPKLTLVIADQPYKFNNVYFAPHGIDRWKVYEWVQRVYPLSAVKVYFRTLPTTNAWRKQNKDGGWDLIYPNCGTVNSYLAYNRVAITGNPFLPDDTAYYGLVADDAGFMRGCSPVGGTYIGSPSIRIRVASGPSGDADWGWDYDGSYADWYAGHEIGHAFGRPHVRGGPGKVKDGCGGEAYAQNHYPNGRISSTTNLSDPKAVFGFDTLQLLLGKNPILGPNWHDMMTYCDYQWMSDITDNILKFEFENTLPLVENPQSTSVQDVLAVFGTLDPRSGEVTLQPVSILFGVPDVLPPTPGPYAIVLRDATGSELARYPFAPYGQSPGQSPYEEAESEYSYISELVPYVDGTTRLEIEAPGGSVLKQINAGINPPTVQVTAPNGREILDSETVTVTWTASDEDGDPLTFNIDYSPDNGGSWEPVALFITDTQVTIEQVNLPASQQGLFRVSASDGIHTASDSSDAVFTIPNHLPSGDIVDPASEVTIAVSQTITFEGQVYDIDLGTLDEDNLQWFSDQEGLLGTGALMNTASLSAGVHTITLMADDGQGQTWIDQVIVTVVPSPNDLPPQPDALMAGPDLIFLDPSSGIYTSTVYVDNLNLGSVIPWTASIDQAWLQLSANSGRTPQDLVVTSRLQPLDFGTHKATITFTSSQGLINPVKVEVVATIPKYDTFLPVLLR
jgi:hypothetical protein